MGCNVHMIHTVIIAGCNALQEVQGAIRAIISLNLEMKKLVTQVELRAMAAAKREEPKKAGQSSRLIK